MILRILFLTCLAGCASTPQSASRAQPEPLAPTGWWTPHRLGQSPYQGPKDAPGPPTFEFRPDLNRLAGSDGCNAFQTGYQVDEGRQRLSVGLIISTQKLCSWSPSGRSITGQLGQVVGYRFEPGPLLHLLDAQGRDLLVLKPFIAEPLP